MSPVYQQNLRAIIVLRLSMTLRERSNFNGVIAVGGMNINFYLVVVGTKHRETLAETTVWRGAASMKQAM